MTKWLWAASFLLVTGVALVGAGIETHQWFYYPIGYIVLFFVPPLIAEHVESRR